MEKEKLKVNYKRRQLTANLKGIGFMDGESYIIYLPSVEVSAYGDTIEEAKEMVNVCLDEFSADLFNLTERKMKSYLKELGWAQGPYFPKRMVNLSKTTFEDIKKEFDLPETTQVEELSFAL